jgi:hypothetical protein
MITMKEVRTNPLSDACENMRHIDFNQQILVIRQSPFAGFFLSLIEVIIFILLQKFFL